jgi:hypothetical protein
MTDVFRTAILASFFLCLLVPRQSNAQSVCPAFSDPVVEVHLQLADIEHDYSMTAKTLTKYRKQLYAEDVVPAHQLIGGLRVSQVNTSGDVIWSRAYDRSGRMICQSVKSVQIKISMDPKIYIAKEDINGPCGEETLVHEMRHVEVDLQFANTLGGILQTKIKAYLQQKRGAAPMLPDDSDHARLAENNDIQSIISREFKKAARRAQALQDRVDSPQEYARIQAICDAAKRAVYDPKRQ